MAADWTRYFDAKTVTLLASIGFKPGGRVEGNLVGNHRSPFHGFAVEFAGHRGYAPGDDLKHLDWKAYYKTRKYLVKQYEQETNLIAQVLVDVSESMLFEYEHGRRIDYAAFVATALSQVITAQSDRVGVALFDNQVRAMIPPTGGQEIVAKIADTLDATAKKEPTAIGKVLLLLAESFRRRGVVFIISDFFADIGSTLDGVRRLRHDRHEVVLIHLLDPLELNFQIPGRVRLLELEGPGKLDVVGAEIKDSYQTQFDAYLAEFKRRAIGLGADYIRCDLGRPFGHHLAEYLARRARQG
ncbi:MAG: DUF58 domain-containing protein [Lentisphaeria bacterium]|jgi:uncharacterized protein (DUF58 family)